MLLSGTALVEPAFPENIQITDDPRVQQRPIVAVNPLDLNHAVIAFDDAEHQRHVDAELGDAVGIAVSLDGGESWQLGTVPLPASFDDFGFHPVIEFDDSGRLFVAFSAGRINPGSEIPPRFIDGRPTEEEFLNRISRDRGLFVARSDDGGLSWNEPVAAELFTGDPVFLERNPDLAFDSFELLPDSSANPNRGNLYVTWTRFYPRGEFPGGGTGSDAMLAVSRDGGATCETQLEEREFFDDANGDGIRQDEAVTTVEVSVLRDPLNTGNAFGSANFGFGQIDVGPEEDVYVTDLGVETFTVFHSTDGGESFVGPDRGNELRVPFGPGLFADPGQVSWPDDALIADTTRQIVADPVRPGHVYVVEAITVRGPGGVIDLADVFFARSTDHGATWETNFTGNGAGGDANLPLNDDNGGQSATSDDPNEIISGQTFPILAGDEAGNLAVVWYDTRRDPNDLRLFDVFGTVSTDGGLNFSPNFRITDESFDFQAGKPELDAEVAFRYSGLAVANNTAYVAWTDGRTGNQDIFFASFTIDPAREALSDRFELNDTPQDTTDSGRVV